MSPPAYHKKRVLQKNGPNTFYIALEIKNLFNLRPRINGLRQYQPLLKQLIIRDIKLKYRRSFLGYVWSILNPLLTMMVLVVVFSNLFRFDIPNFPVYLICGSTLYAFLAEATSMSASSIMTNSALLKKTYVPKYIFPLSRVTSSLVNLLFAFVAIILVIIYTGLKITPLMLLTPLVIFELYVFSLGLSMFLAAATVYCRDILYLWGIFLTLWNYLTPIFYPVSIIPEKYRFWYCSLNPMYIYITQFRDLVLNGTLPDLYSVSLGIAMAIVSVIMGTIFFMRSQDNFILYI